MSSVHANFFELDIAETFRAITKWHCVVLLSKFLLNFSSFILSCTIYYYIVDKQTNFNLPNEKGFLSELVSASFLVRQLLLTRSRKYLFLLSFGECCKTIEILSLEINRTYKICKYLDVCSMFSDIRWVLWWTCLVWMGRGRLEYWHHPKNTIVWSSPNSCW